LQKAVVTHFYTLRFKIFGLANGVPRDPGKLRAVEIGLQAT
jgi:hypothetical protein